MRKYFRSLAQMCPDAVGWLRRGMELTVLMLVCALLMLVWAGPYAPDTYRLYDHALELCRLPAAVLFVVSTAAVVSEETHRNK